MLIDQLLINHEPVLRNEELPTDALQLSQHWSEHDNTNLKHQVMGRQRVICRSFWEVIDYDKARCSYDQWCAL